MSGGRLYQLDLIRGLLAVGVMVYHIVPGTPTVFGTWGVYFFFVLSGWALTHVYGSRMEVGRFAVARFARLAPLWIPVVLLNWAHYSYVHPIRLGLNLTGAFGFVLPGATSMVMGGWSIGIEAVCYCLFPPLVLLSTRSLVVVTLLAFALRWWWVGGLMPADIVAEWVRYTQIQSFLVFFTAGMLLARTVRLPRWSGRRAAVSTVLGDASYGTYLLHPIVFAVVGAWALLLTPVLALGIHRWYEVPLGSRLREVLRKDVRVRPADLDPVDHEDGGGQLKRGGVLHLIARRVQDRL